MRGARLVRTQGLGHRRILSAPAVHEEIGAFLSQLAPPSRMRGIAT